MNKLSERPIKGSEIFKLKQFLDNPNPDIVENYFKKEYYYSTAKNYKPGSDLWNKEIDKDKENEAIPDYNVKSLGSIELSPQHKSISTLDIFEITYDSVEFDHDEGHYTVTNVKKFLTCNGLHRNTLIGTFSQLLELRDVQSALEESLKEIEYNKIRESLSKFPIAFSILQNTIYNAMFEFKNVEYYEMYHEYNNCVVIDDKIVYAEEELTLIYNDYKIGKKFYINDKLARQGYDEDYFDFHKRMVK